MLASGPIIAASYNSTDADRKLAMGTCMHNSGKHAKPVSMYNWAQLRTAFIWQRDIRGNQSA